MAGTALGRFSAPAEGTAPARGWAAAAVAAPARCGRAGRAAADAAQAEPARGEHGHGSRRGEHAQGDQPEVPVPARPRGSGVSPGAVSPGSSGSIPAGRLSGQYALEPLSHGGRHGGRGSGGEQRGDLGQLAAQAGAVMHRPPGAPRSGRHGAR